MVALRNDGQLNTLDQFEADSWLITQRDLEQFGIVTEDIQHLLEFANHTLYERVGLAIAAQLSNDELRELIDRQGSNSKRDLFAWLAERVPTIDEIIDDERAILLSEVAKNAQEFNS